jgi:hypothetical protein
MAPDYFKKNKSANILKTIRAHTEKDSLILCTFQKISIMCYYPMRTNLKISIFGCKVPVTLCVNVNRQLHAVINAYILYSAMTHIWPQMTSKHWLWLTPPPPHAPYER